MPGLVDVPGRSAPFPMKTGGAVSGSGEVDGNWEEGESKATDRTYYVREE